MITMKPVKDSVKFGTAIIAASFAFACSALGQQIAYDDAGQYLINANWTNGANQGFGFTPWVIITNGPDSQGTYINSGNSPTFVIATVTNVMGTNYTCVWGTYANGTTAPNETTAYRGFVSPLGTNTFKLQWGSRGAGATTTTNNGVVHGWCGFALRDDNTYTNAPYYSPQDPDFVPPNGDPTVQFYLWFEDGASPSTIYYADGNGIQSVPGTSFSNLGRNNITNAIEAEITPTPDGSSYHMVLKDCVQNVVLYTANGSFFNGGQGVASAALFDYETTGDQVYNNMQITASTNIPPSISNVQPTNGAVYVDPSTALSFEVDSFNSTVSSNAVSVYLNGVLQTGFTYNTTTPTSQLTGSGNPALALNTFYNYTIVAQDANGNTVSNNFTFNTFSSSNNVFIDAMDYNFGAGQFINPAGVALYGNLLGTNGIDFLDLTTTNEIGIPGNTNNYRPQNVPAPQLIPIGLNGAPSDPVDHEGFNSFNSSIPDYQLAFTDQGEWDNYTRVFPTNTYSIYARAASSSGGQFQLALLANPTATVSNQPLAVIGTVGVQDTGSSLIYSGQLSPLDFFRPSSKRPTWWSVYSMKPAYTSICRRRTGLRASGISSQLGISAWRAVSCASWGMTPSAFWRAMVSSRSLSQPWSKLPLYLSAHSLGTWWGAWVAPGAK